MGDAIEQGRALTAEEMDLVTGAFLGLCIASTPWVKREFKGCR